ncbi:MAG: ATP-dependent nuclease [Sedimentisphaeraceae bacterium JB056]
MSDTVIKIKNHKCFRDKYSGFDCIKPINVIIGKNNSGKSSLLDIIDFATKVNYKDRLDCDFLIEKEFSESNFKHFFNQPNLAFKLRFLCKLHGNHLSIKKYIDANNLQRELSNMGFNLNQQIELHKQDIQASFNAGIQVPEFFKNKKVLKIIAERDMKAEGYSHGTSLHVAANGGGATTTITSYVHNVNLDRFLIQKKLLDALNEVFNPDSYFTEIYVPNIKGSQWEVYFTEKDKEDPIPLSKSGSGLKTILLVLLNLLVIPKTDAYKNVAIENILYSFEELENNLHPALLRRLFKYIEKFAKDNKCHFFITTHSNVAIDMFCNSPDAQIIHVTHDGKQAYAKTVEAFNDHNAVLDDLGVKASDLLQANGIVWLEGPSDRIYFNKWIELYSKGELQEHRDYECAFYGGSILDHFEANGENDGDDDAINVLKVNRNAILIGDSDRDKESKQIKDRLSRIRTELEFLGGYVWVTDAREVENYIPVEALRQLYEKEKLPEIEKYQKYFDEYTRANKLPKPSKVDLSRSLVPLITKEMLDNMHDLSKEMEIIIQRIKSWNSEK